MLANCAADTPQETAVCCNCSGTFPRKSTCSPLGYGERGGLFQELTIAYTQDQQICCAVITYGSDLAAIAAATLRSAGPVS